MAIVAIVAVASGIGVCWWLAGRTGPPPAAPLRAESLWALAVAYAPAAAWLLAAIGLGRLVSPILPVLATRLQRTLVATAVGVALLMAIDSLLGRLGLLTAGGGTVAWGLTAVLALAAAIPRRSPPPSEDQDPPEALPGWAGLAFAPALGALLLASLAAPGWLWSSEFGGYDVLSYHLLLPREWFESGVMGPLAHNAYSGLPSHVEASTLHLMALVRDPLAAALPAQALQACLAALAAATIAAAARCWFGASAGLLAAGIFLGTPWTVVTGSLAYNEATVSLMLAAGLVLTVPEPPPAGGELGDLRRRAGVVGILAAGAVGAKATSIALVALPLGVLLLKAAPRGRRLPAALLGSLAALPMLAPWLLQNTVEFGQPFFPLMAGVLGGGGWSPEQIAIFNTAHGPPAGAGAGGWVTAFVDELLRHGLGPNPTPGEPWRPWWGLLWPLGGLAGVAAIASGGRRRQIGIRLVGALLVMLALWILFTHWESRFLAPAAVPLALLAAAAWPWASPHVPARSGIAAAVAVVVAWGLLPVAILLGERPLGDGPDRIGAPAAATGQVEAVSGRLHRRLLRDPSLDREARAAVLATAPIWTFVNEPTLTGRDGRAMLVGEARGFYLERPSEYASVWNRGRLSELVRAHPDDPDAWRRGLREAGISLVVLDEGMIERWRRDGWWDEALDAEAIAALRRVLVPLKRFPSGVELLEVRDRRAPAAPPERDR
jgi:hypothetical protein